MTAGLPDGFAVRLHDGVTFRGAVLVGASPQRMVKLSERALAMFCGREVRVDSAETRALAERLLDLNLARPVLDRVTKIGLDQLTIVVPIRDRAQQLDRLLKGIAAAVACVVVDDASVNAKAIFDVADRWGATVIRLDDNAGPAQARNIGLSQVETPFVAFVDSDVSVSPTVLAGLLHHFADPRTAAAAPRIRPAPGSRLPRWLAIYEATASSLDLGPVPALVQTRSPVTYVPSACLLVRTGPLAEGFDASMRVGEDVDLVWRLLAGGHRVHYVANLEAFHDTRDDLWAWCRQKFSYGTSAAPLARRHGDRVAPAVFSPLGALTAAGLLVQRRRPVIAALAALGPVGLLVRDRIPPVDGRDRIAVQVALRAGRSAFVQASGLLLRHWWPLTLVGCMRSGSLRKAAVRAAVIDGVVNWRRQRSDLDCVTFTAVRRLDDLTYGAGLWVGVWRERSVRALLPSLTRRHRQR